ncbi:protein starmaker-like isoform X3 [Lineus longissimus]|uniref:protein starmaker-like isoform X3 n=1 Tax=Lineus longissimus TaxID=88925 RepID=UPI00315D5AB1
MSNFIPMLSSSPPPLDDSQSFNDGWPQHNDDDDDDFGGFTSAGTKSEESTNFANFNSECPAEVQKVKDLNSHDHDNANDFGGFADFKSGKDSEPGWANFSSAHSDTSPNTDSQSGFADLSSPASSGPPVLSPRLNDNEEDDEFADFEQGPTKREILENKLDSDTPKRPNSVHFQRSEKTDTPSGTETPGSERYPGFKKSSIDNTSQDSIIDSGLSSDISPLPKSEDYPDFSEDNKSNDLDCDFAENKSVSSCHNSDNNPTSCDNMSNSFQGQGEPSQGLDDSQDTLVDSKSSEQPVEEDENVENVSNCQSELISESESPSERTSESGGENVAPCGAHEGVDSGHEKEVSKEDDFADFEVGETNSDHGSDGSDGDERHLCEENSNHSSTLPQDCTVADGDDFGGFSSVQNDAGSCSSDMSEGGAGDEKCDRSSPIPENMGTINTTPSEENTETDSLPVAENKSSVFEENTEIESDSSSPGDTHGTEVDNCVNEDRANVESTGSEMEEGSEVGVTLGSEVVENDTLGEDEEVEDEEGNVKASSDMKTVVEQDGDSSEQKDDSESNTGSGSKGEEELDFGELSFRAPGTPDEGLEDGDGFDGVEGDATGDEWAGCSSGVLTEGGAGDDDGDEWAAFGTADSPAGDNDDWAAFSGATTEPPPLPYNDDDEETFSGPTATEPPPQSEIPDNDDGDDEWAGFSGPSSSVPPPMPDDDNDDGDDDWGGFSAPEPVAKDTSPTQDDDDEFGEFTEPPAPLDKPSPSSEKPSTAQVWSKVAKPQAAKVDSAISKCFPNLQINAALVTIATLTNVVGKELERASKPKTTDRQKKQKSTPSVIDVNIWQHLKDLEETNALTCTWSHSSNNQRLLKALAIDPRNILVTKKAAVPIFAASLGLLEPSRGGVLEPTKPGDVTEPTLVDTSKETPVQQPVVIGMLLNPKTHHQTNQKNPQTPSSSMSNQNNHPKQVLLSQNNLPKQVLLTQNNPQQIVSQNHQILSPIQHQQVVLNQNRPKQLPTLQACSILTSLPKTRKTTFQPLPSRRHLKLNSSARSNLLNRANPNP